MHARVHEIIIPLNEVLRYLVARQALKSEGYNSKLCAFEGLIHSNKEGYIGH
jgi:hypothetical protein